jgi:hypothetical protein
MWAVNYQSPTSSFNSKLHSLLSDSQTVFIHGYINANNNIWRQNVKCDLEINKNKKS